ncbi:MAG TPA: ATP--guanido phosphotransferase, partial [Armatimonadota bacterium]
LARNLEGHSFPGHGSPEQEALVLECVRIAFSPAEAQESFRFLPLAGLRSLERRILVERHLISPDLANHHKYAAVAFTEDTRLSVMVNEEDHLRLQALRAGLDPVRTWKEVDGFDDWLGHQVPYAYRSDYGFLTTHLANCGTGLRCSVMLHLPALLWTERLPDVLRAASRLGVMVRGTHGEGTESTGDLYQVSNQHGLGYSEPQIVGQVEAVARHLVEGERRAREALVKRDRQKVLDAAYRSYGLLRYARVMDSVEALGLLSRLRLGQLLGLLEEVSDATLRGLLLAVQPASLQSLMGQAHDEEDQSLRRANFIRACLKAQG